MGAGSHLADILVSAVGHAGRHRNRSREWCPWRRRVRQTLRQRSKNHPTSLYRHGAAIGACLIEGSRTEIGNQTIKQRCVSLTRMLICPLIMPDGTDPSDGREEAAARQGSCVPLQCSRPVIGGTLCNALGLVVSFPGTLSPCITRLGSVVNMSSSCTGLMRKFVECVRYTDCYRVRGAPCMRVAGPPIPWRLLHGGRCRQLTVPACPHTVPPAARLTSRDDALCSTSAGGEEGLYGLLGGAT